MALHDSLRDLVAVRGAGVVADADELRGALDDFLAEDEATLGEMNLLVDAVRLGALRRTLDVLDHGADPEAAVREAGAALARDRGTDDPTRSCWAIAALCFALGRVDESLVRTFRADAGTMPAPAPPPPPPTPKPTPAPAPPVPTVEVDPPAPEVPQPAPAPPGPPAPPVSPVVVEGRPSRAGTFLLVVLVALIVGGLVAAGVILLRADDDEPSAGDDPSKSPSATGRERPEPLVPPTAMLAPYGDGEGSRIYQIEVATGASRPLTPGGTDAKLPTISPDRRTMTYQVGATPSVTMIVDLEARRERPLFDEDGPCGLAGRPAWSPDGSRIAMLCAAADGDEDPDGIWVADADGGNLTGLGLDPVGLNGSPTWISATEFVYGMTDPATGEVSFWRADVEGAEPEEIEFDLEGHLSHIDWSPEQKRLLLLQSPSAEDVSGAVWTMKADGTDLQQVADGSFAHPVWSPDGDAIGVTLPDPATGDEVLGYIPLDRPDSPEVVPDPPTDQVGVPVWGSR